MFGDQYQQQNLLIGFIKGKPFTKTRKMMFMKFFLHEKEIEILSARKVKKKKRKNGTVWRDLGQIYFVFEMTMSY